jgi:hypothetical protein
MSWMCRRDTFVRLPDGFAASKVLGISSIFVKVNSLQLDERAGMLNCGVIAVGNSPGVQTPQVYLLSLAACMRHRRLANPQMQRSV